jgi:arylsulfate sulfotransferase
LTALEKMPRKTLYLSGLLAILILIPTALEATVSILSMTPSVASPQPLGTAVTWTVTAKDTGKGPLVFQFKTAYGQRSLSLARDFNVGTLASGTWTSPPFVWATIAGEGSYQIQAIAKDFGSGQTATLTASFQLTPLDTGGQAAVSRTANPLVALFSAPSCAAGSQMRVSFVASAGSPTYTNWNNCQPPVSMNFYVAGMPASTTYSLNYQVNTGGTITNGPTSLNFTTGALPTQITFPSYTLITPPGPQADTTDSTLLHAVESDLAGGEFLPLATDLNGNVTWYYASGDAAALMRPLSGGLMLTLQDGKAWNPGIDFEQYLREIDLAGNIVRETNTGIVSQELLAMGVTDATPCNQVPKPPPVGTACLNHFHHEAMELPNGYIALLGKIEKLFPIGTQGSTTGQPVDVLGDILMVLDTNWQVVWYFDEFQYLNTNRADPLNDVCSNGPKSDCPPNVLASAANDWTHTNCIYYMASSGDLMISVRDQDWLLKIDYNNGTGTGNILWTMGVDGDFSFQNTPNDPYPWFSHQHDAEFQTNGVLTVFDNGNTRIAPPPIGLGSGYSRGMALSVDETSMQVAPVLSESMGIYCEALGSAALLSNGNYFFQPGLPVTYDIQIFPTQGATTGLQVYNLEARGYNYRAWQMPNLYTAPPNQNLPQ